MPIHPTALISDKASLGKNADIGAYTIIHDQVEIGDNVTIGSHCELGIRNSFCAEDSKLVIGNDSLIRSHSIFYSGSKFAPGLTTGHRVTVREMTNAGLNLQIGTLSDIQGHCEIGNYVRFHSNVHIGQKSKIGNYVWIFPYVVLTNDPHPPSEYLIGCTIEDYAVIATMSVILPGVKVSSDSLVGAGSIVKRDVTHGKVVAGNPAKEVCDISDINLRNAPGKRAYPWREHFHRGYPSAVVESWISEVKTD